jgi:hypothetical protein
VTGEGAVSPPQANGSHLQRPGNAGFMSFERRRCTTTQAAGCCASEAANGRATGYSYDQDDRDQHQGGMAAGCWGRVTGWQGEAVWMRNCRRLGLGEQACPRRTTGLKCRGLWFGQDSGMAIAGVAAGNEGVRVHGATQDVVCGGCVTTTRCRGYE